MPGAISGCHLLFLVACSLELQLIYRTTPSSGELAVA